MTTEILFIEIWIPLNNVFKKIKTYITALSLWENSTKIFYKYYTNKYINNDQLLGFFAILMFIIT